MEGKPMYTPDRRRAAHRAARASRAMRSALPLLGLAYVLASLMWAGSSDFASGVR